MAITEKQKKNLNEAITKLNNVVNTYYTYGIADSEGWRALRRWFAVGLIGVEVQKEITFQYLEGYEDVATPSKQRMIAKRVAAAAEKVMKSLHVASGDVEFEDWNDAMDFVERYF